MDVLKAAPPPILRQESVDCPELGGAVIVRGLLASEAFAVGAYRSQALRRVHAERAAVAAAATADGSDAPPAAQTIDPVDLQFDELVAYARYVSHLLACAVTLSNGLQLYTADQWEVAGQHHPKLLPRLQAVAERLSGLNVEDVEKN